MIPGSGYHEWAASKQRLQAPQSFFSLPGHARRFSFSTRSTKKHVRRLLTVKFSRATSYFNAPINVMPAGVEAGHRVGI